MWKVADGPFVLTLTVLQMCLLNLTKEPAVCLNKRREHAAIEFVGHINPTLTSDGSFELLDDKLRALPCGLAGSSSATSLGRRNSGADEGGYASMYDVDPYDAHGANGAMALGPPTSNSGSLAVLPPRAPSLPSSPLPWCGPSLSSPVNPQATLHPSLSLCPMCHDLPSGSRQHIL